MKPRLVIGDDHTLFVEALCTLLTKEYVLTGTARNGRELIGLVEEQEPDLVLLDISMPVLNGIEALRRISKHAPQTKSVVITQQSDKEYARAAFEAGAKGYILKQSAFSELAVGLREVLAGHTFISPILAPELAAGLSAQAEPCRLFDVRLTARKREVLQLVAEGKTLKEIAFILQISTKTVEFHKASIMDQLGLRSTAELTRYAIEKGISRY